MEWTVVTALVVIVGLFATVGAPALKLNGTIVKLNTIIETQAKEIAANKAEIKEMKDHAHESHKRLWEHNEEQDGVLANHEQRIHDLESK